MELFCFSAALGVCSVVSSRNLIEVQAFGGKVAKSVVDSPEGGACLTDCAHQLQALKLAPAQTYADRGMRRRMG